jgi:hypothetical protein
MADLRTTLQTYVDDRSLPGAVSLIARGDRIEATVVGSAAGRPARPR